jgi:hypothetical protein
MANAAGVNFQPHLAGTWLRWVKLNLLQRSLVNWGSLRKLHGFH